MQPNLEDSSLARLLRELSDESGPPYSWNDYQRRAQRRTSAARDRAGGRSFAALGAIALGIVALSLRLGEPLRPALHQGSSSGVRGGGQVLELEPAAMSPGASRTDPRIDSLERWLATLPDEPALVRVGNRAAVTGLEDRLAEVDDLLTAERVDRGPPARLLALLQERRQLVSSLAQVRYAQTLADASR